MFYIRTFIKFLRNILLEAYYLAQDVYSAIKVAEFQAFVMVAVKNPFMRDRLREERFSNSCKIFCCRKLTNVILLWQVS